MKISLPRFDKSFIYSIAMDIVALLSLALFIKLGYWQIQRGNEKQAMIANFSEKTRLPAISWDGKSNLPVQYQKIKVSGKFLPKFFFLDNQFRDHKFGYNVIQPLVLNNGWIVLVDKGWFPVNSRENFSPRKFVKLTAHTGEIIGTSYYPSKKTLILGTPFEKITKKYIIVESPDPKLISKILHKSIYPFIIRESENFSDTLLKNWPLVSMQPSRHYAYALQWFCFALVVVIIYFVLKRKNA